MRTLRSVAFSMLAVIIAIAAANVQSIPNDSLLFRQWYLGTGVPNAINIGAVGAWRYSHGPAVGSWYHVAMINGGGVEEDHPDFVRPNGLRRVDSNVPFVDTHSTNVAGIIAAVTNNGRGIAGIDWNSNLYAIDASFNTPGPTPGNVRSYTIGLTNLGYKVTNHSYGDPDFDVSVAQALTRTRAEAEPSCRPMVLCASRGLMGPGASARARPWLTAPPCHGNMHRRHVRPR
jgi:hypothetical protein